ncbi:MAG: hypothetical protein IJY92_00625 [Alphaproteobacteria bacterium]|nr:hypothetical protein [Alphaproteobacteria bacterium]
MKNELMALCAFSGLILSGCKDDIIPSHASFVEGDNTLGTVIDMQVVENKYQTKAFYLISTDANKQDAEYVGYVSGMSSSSQLVGQAYNAKKLGMQKTLYEWQKCLSDFERIRK